MWKGIIHEFKDKHFEVSRSSSTSQNLSGDNRKSYYEISDNSGEIC